MVDKLIGGRYTLLERHAIGGMAVLWRARDERTGEVVALKRLHPYLVADASARSRLVREAAALRAVDHPSITRPREVIDDPDDPALVMEFAEGRSLKNRLDEGALEPEEAVAIAATVADALAVAHQAGIVHRDIKPANILVEDSGAVHLVDFGIATLGPADEAGLTVAGTMIGTVRYSAPERLAGAESTPRSDVWGLGAVLFEMLAGRPAVDGEARTVSGGGPGHAPDTSSMPPALGTIVQRAMAPDPANRYADAGAFRDALLSGEGIVNPLDETTIVPLPALTAAHGSVAMTPAPSGGFSFVDRAAAVFFSGAVAVTLGAAVVLGLGSAGQTAAPVTDPPARVIEAAPSPTDVVMTPAPEDDDNSGRGNVNGNGNGKGKGNDKDDKGDD